MVARVGLETLALLAAALTQTVPQEEFPGKATWAGVKTVEVAGARVPVRIRAAAAALLSEAKTPTKRLATLLLQGTLRQGAETGVRLLSAVFLGRTAAAEVAVAMLQGFLPDREGSAAAATAGEGGVPEEMARRTLGAGVAAVAREADKRLCPRALAEPALFLSATPSV